MAGKDVMVIAHGNSLRGIVKIVDNLTESEISSIYIPNAIPLVFKFHRNMTTTPLKDSVKPLSGQFLEKEGLLKAALAREEEFARRVSSYVCTYSCIFELYCLMCMHVCMYVYVCRFILFRSQ